MVPVSYNIRSLAVRWKTTLLSVSGFTLVVAALVVLLACIKGVQTVCVASGEPRNVLVLNRGSNDEAFNRMQHEIVAQVENVDGVDRDSSGRPLASRELFMVVQPYSQTEQGYVFLQVRGVTRTAFAVHTTVRLHAGRMFRPGRGEVIVGRAIQRAQGLEVGDRLGFGDRSWRIAGFFEAGGAAFESEIWCDLPELASQFRSEGLYSSVVLRAPDEATAAALAERLNRARHVTVRAVLEPEYYAGQGKDMEVIRLAVLVMAGVMGAGSILAIMNTMFASISQRSQDIALLRLLGFESWHILLGFLLEAVLIAVFGGILGIGLGYLTNGLSQSITIGMRELAFAFQVDAAVVTTAALFTLTMGILGGLLPAMSAMTIKPLEALR